MGPKILVSPRAPKISGPGLRLAHELAHLGWSCDVNRAMLWEYDVPASIVRLVSGEMSQ
jgi:hypothetical protein